MQLKRDNHIQLPTDNIAVIADFFCALCKTKYKEPILQGTLRRFPKQMNLKGKIIKTRQPDGTFIKACKTCADEFKRYQARQNQKKTTIIT